MSVEKVDFYEEVVSISENKDNISSEMKLSIEEKSLKLDLCHESFGEYGQLCYESFFVGSLTNSEVYINIFIDKYAMILNRFLLLRDSSSFVQERSCTYFLNALVFLYTEHENAAYRNKFIDFLSFFFMKDQQGTVDYQFVYRYIVFKIITSLVKVDDFRIREFIYNTDFIDILFETRSQDLMVDVSKWKFLDLVSASTTKVNKDSVLNRESVRSFIKSNLNTSIGALKSLIRDIIKSNEGLTDFMFA